MKTIKRGRSLIELLDCGCWAQSNDARAGAWRCPRNPDHGAQHAATDLSSGRPAILDAWDYVWEADESILKSTGSTTGRAANRTEGETENG